MTEHNLQALMAERDEDAERFCDENPDLHELSLFVDGELSEARHEAFIQKLLASESLQASMESYLAMDLAAAAAGPQDVSAVVEELEKQAARPKAKIFNLQRSVASLAAAACILFTVLGSTGPLEVDVQPQGERVRSAMALTGDVVLLASPAWPWASKTLRVYASADSLEETKLVFECPGDDACSPGFFGMKGRWIPEAPGSYRVVFLQGHFRSIPPSTGDLLEDLESWKGLSDKTTVVRVGARSP